MVNLPPLHGGRDDATLLARVATGDEQAFGVLFERYRAAVYRFARQMGGSAEAADDITQEVFVALMRTAAHFNPGLGSVTTYLYGITRNVVRQRLRKHATRREVELSRAPDDTPEFRALSCTHDDLEREQALVALRRAIAALPAHYREVIVLCELHELTYEDAARVVGCPIGTIRSRLNRARRVLAERCRVSIHAPAPSGTLPATRRCLA